MFGLFSCQCRWAEGFLWDGTWWPIIKDGAGILRLLRLVGVGCSVRATEAVCLSQPWRQDPGISEQNRQGKSWTHRVYAEPQMATPTGHNLGSLVQIASTTTTCIMAFRWSCGSISKPRHSWWRSSWRARVLLKTTGKIYSTHRRNPQKGDEWRNVQSCKK